jgi:preprotein translocase subunit SecA
MDSVVSHTWRMLSQHPNPAEPPKGLDALWHQTSGLIRRISRGPRHYLHEADAIMAQEKTLRHVSDRKLRDLMAPLHDRFRRNRAVAEERNMAFALLREVAERTIGLRPYREQVAAALALEAGCIAEMATGEGKTLVATFPAVLAGWRGRGCHVITANEYLATRDADLMRAIYHFCDLRVGCIAQGMSPAERKQAYNQHVTYCTNKEVAADYLRDRLLKGTRQGLPSVLLSKIVGDPENRIDRLVLRGLECAIVDEADSVFIDEAATPLLISGDGPNQAYIEAYEQAAWLSGRLDPSADYRIDPSFREVRLTATGKQRLSDEAEPLGGLWTGERRREELVLQALSAAAFFIRGKHYIVDDNKVVIIDEFTGRPMPERTWRGGIHQAVEAKEGLAINLPKETYARISFQRFFRHYRKLSGMSGTVAEAQTEMWRIYGLPVISIPTHRSCKRLVMPERVFTTTDAKWVAVMESIHAVHSTGRPVLVGTGSIRDSEHLSSQLAARKVKHALLNGARQASEAQIIERAGQKGRVTVSTNMAGRGTDIRLGAGVAALGGLHVIATERFGARRIDRQLSGRCARQGDPGSTQAFISLEDELPRKYSRLISVAISRYYCNNNTEISSKFWRRIIGIAQRRAERVSLGMREGVLSADNWLDDHLGFAFKEL